MTTMNVELYEGLRAAGAPEDKAQAAARALAEHGRRCDHVDAELAAIPGKLQALEGQVIMVKWITGATLAGILALILRTFVQGCSDAGLTCTCGARPMTRHAAFLIVALLAGCATAPPEPAPRAGAAASLEAAPDAAERSSPAASAGPSDWALAIVGTPFVFAFRVVTCAATAVVAGPTAGLLALSDERDAGLDYLRWGLAENCDGPYVVSVPVAAGYRAEPDVRYAPRPDVREYPEPDRGPPRPLIPDSPSP